MDMIKVTPKGRNFDYHRDGNFAYAFIADAQNGYYYWRFRDASGSYPEVTLSYNLCATMEDFFLFVWQGRNA